MVNTMRTYFSAEGRAAKIFQGFSKHTLVLLQVRKHDKMCDRVFLER